MPIPTNVQNIFGNTGVNAAQTVTTSEVALATQTATGNSFWGKIPTLNKSDIGLTLDAQFDKKGFYYTVTDKPNLTTNNEGDLVDTGKKTMWNLDANLPIGVNGTGYKSAQNHHVATSLFAAMDKNNVDVTNAYTRVRVDNNGAKAMAEIVLPSTQVKIGQGQLGDEIAASVRVINSFDGSTAYWVIVSVYRIACMNGMIMPSGVIQYKSTHCNDLSISRSVDVICQGLETFQNDRELLEAQTTKLVSNQDVYEALCIMNKVDLALAPTYEEYQRVIRPTLKRQPAIERHVNLWKKYRKELGSTQWALNNTLTHISTHGDKPEFTASQTITGRINKEKLVHEAMQACIAA